MPKRDERGLVLKQRRFVEEYTNPEPPEGQKAFNATSAAIRAGYSKNGAGQTGFNLLKKPEIQEAIAERVLSFTEQADTTIERVLLEYAALGFSDMANYVTFNGEEAVINFDHMPEGATRAISEITTEIYMERHGDDEERVKRVRLKLHDKKGSLDSIGKFLRMFLENRAPAGTPEDPIQHEVKHTFDFGGYQAEFAAFLRLSGDQGDGPPDEDGLEESLDTP